VRHSFGLFLEKVSPDGWVVTSQQILDEHAMLPWPDQTRPAPDLEKSVKLPLIGEHMRRNAALAVAMSERLGTARAEAVAALHDFGGLERRLEKLGMLQDLLVLSDYGHHPAEIRATLRAVRQHYGGQKILVILEVHTLERLSTFFDDFVDAVSLADGVILVPVFLPTGREAIVESADRELRSLQHHLKARGLATWRVSSDKDLRGRLTVAAAHFDLAVAFSAGPLDGQLRNFVNSS